MRETLKSMEIFFSVLLIKIRFRWEGVFVVSFIAERIKEARDISLEEGQAKYRAFFIKTALYRRYQSEVDVILEIDGYADCIVTE